MAIVAVFENPNATTEGYDRVGQMMNLREAPPGAIFHAACKRPGGGLFVVECWESEQALREFAKRLEPMIEQAGAPKRPEPKIYEVHRIRDRSRP